MYKDEDKYVNLKIINLNLNLNFYLDYDLNYLVNQKSESLKNNIFWFPSHRWGVIA